ncbi:hypothetical protein GCM10011430_27130 [Oxalicibacterium solurbis]|uniref:eCIS core domain-containing protein n=1 Tax=Oxalicibacterium solurbis TaxID=69280 RepID=A0A8J3AXW2_9BURK|nr:hypothetical protein GCM10011430_27130 [Oxalicibacterium solurbis]
MAEKADASEGAMRQHALQKMANAAQRAGRDEEEEEKPAQGKFARPAQRQAAAGMGSGGLPPQLKSGIEALSGMSMDDVRVHYNSSQPAQLNALAYAQGRDIHVGPGQEQHLPHEAWHVVQQAQGRVQPTMQMKDGVPVNDDHTLEEEADRMGAQAMQMRVAGAATPMASASGRPVAQFFLPPHGMADTKGYYKAQGNAKNTAYGSGRPADFSTKFKANMVEHEWGGSYNKETDMWHVTTHGDSQVVLPTNAIQIDHVVPWNTIETELQKNPSTVYTPGYLATLKTNGYVVPNGSKYTMFAARMYYHDVGNLVPMAGSENASKGATHGGGGADLETAWMNRAARSTGVHHQMVQTAFRELVNWQGDAPAVQELLDKFDEVDDVIIEAEEFFQGY